jgi:hypothetical protein
MSALIKACKSNTTVKNTGIECNESLGPIAMLIAVPPTLKWTANDMLDFYTYLQTQIHAVKTARAYPLFGPAAPIRKIANNKESDVTVTLDDGTQIFIRYGVYNNLYSTTDGGLCYADTLQSFTRSGFAIIFIDNTGQILMRKNVDGTYSGIKTSFMYASSPDFADFKNPGFTNFQVSFTPQEYVNHGVIMTGDSSIIDLLGLVDADVTQFAAANSTTKLKINVSTECAGTDLIAELGTDLADPTNFLVVDQAAPTVPITITAAAIVGTHIELTGTFITGHTYLVSLAAASVLFGNDIDGYEGVGTAICIIP